MSPSRPKRKGHFARRFIKEAFYQTFYNVGFRKVRVADERLKVEVAENLVFNTNHLSEKPIISQVDSQLSEFDVLGASLRLANMGVPSSSASAFRHLLIILSVT
jgi:hypothetical protein